MLDGEHMAERCVVVTLAIIAGGTKVPVGLWDGSTENKTVVRALPADLVDAGLRFDDGLLVVPRRRQGAVGGRCVRCWAPMPSSSAVGGLCRCSDYVDVKPGCLVRYGVRVHNAKHFVGQLEKS
jgi:hypothetical protein